VGFPKRDTIPELDVKHKVLSKISQKELDKFAVNNLDDSEYTIYRLNGTAPDKFWKTVYDQFIGEEWSETPDGYDTHTVWKNGEQETWMGIDIAYVSDTGSDEVDLEKLKEAQEKIKRDYPNVTTKVILGASGG
jgi:hypothetical protein